MHWKQFFTPIESIDAAQAKKYVNENPLGSFTLLDVRQPGEYQQGHISGAKLIPLPDLMKRQSELPSDKPILVYCSTGGRSRVATQYLLGNNFTQVYNITGGYKSWEGNYAIGLEDQGLHHFNGKESLEEVLKIAYSLEKGLREFYLLMIPLLINPECKALFKKLAEIEIHHQDKIFNEHLKVTEQNTDQKNFDREVENYGMEGGLSTQDYMQLYKPDVNSPQDVISLAMAIEAQALDLYTRASDNSANAESKKFLRQIAQEEQTHLQRLGELFDQL